MASSNGGVPPGFRFHPTDEELLHYYLRKKVSFQKFDLEVIRDVDLNKMEPWDLQELKLKTRRMPFLLITIHEPHFPFEAADIRYRFSPFGHTERCRIGSTPQNEWYFFSHKDRKYPTGSRTNRATNAGFWKATGRDKCIRNSYKKIGMRKTLVFYRGRAPHGQKTDWIMHEYRLEDTDDAQSTGAEDGWVVCRVFKKKNLFKVGNDGSTSSAPDRLMNGGISSADQARGLHTYDLALNYSHVPVATSQYAHLQVPAAHIQSTSKPIGSYGFSAMPAEPEPPMVKQFLSSQGACEGEDGLGRHLPYQQLDGGLEVGSCEQAQQMVERRDESLNDWAMGMRFVDGSAPVHQINHQLSLRGEMDLWGYGK
ncbi:hypothetical protein ACLOJK_016891 [Asimina triloba]